MNFITKIFENKIDQDVHNQFTRFSIGTFENRALCQLTKTAKNLKIKTSFEYANEFVAYLANTIEDKTRIVGMILCTSDISPELPFEVERKNAMGLKKYLFDHDLTKEQILNLYEKFPDALILFNFSTTAGTLKIKQKAPKAGKAGKGEEEPKADYCILTTTNFDLTKEFAFDASNFKKFFAKHTFVIESVNVPKEYETDFNLARKMAKRKGKIIREINIDGKGQKSEINFEA
ncbi:MAG: hypothetical protein KKH88_01215 [Nanoarchaeota archaeon]|nr:hypothetical protein [Nanoarchaeota archaeon]